MDSIINKILVCDNQTLELFNSSLRNKFLDYIFSGITHLGSDIVLIAIFLILFIYAISQKKIELKITCVLSIVAIILSRFAVVILKFIINRPRPFVNYQEIELIHRCLPSFPSGHTTVASTVATVLALRYRKFSWVFISMAILVGLSRIYLGFHYLTDGIAGFLLGAFIGILVFNCRKWITKE